MNPVLKARVCIMYQKIIIFRCCIVRAVTYGNQESMNLFCKSVIDLVISHSIPYCLSFDMTTHLYLQLSSER